MSLIAILSDIHSNLEALDAVLEAADAAGAQQTYVLGDIVGYGADPNEVVARLSIVPEITLLAGNHDLAVTGRFDVSWFNDRAAEAIAWTEKTIAQETVEMLASLRPRETTHHALLVHGSVVDPAAEYVRRAEHAERSFDAEDFRLCFFGHTHRPTVFTTDGADVAAAIPREGEVVTLNGRSMFNPGSVGQPRDGDPRAAFALYDTAARTIRIRRIAYDVTAAQQKIRDAGLPAVLADRLEEGR